jgi:asparagine synthase (glutamine-hydrolysing)
VLPPGSAWGISGPTAITTHQYFSADEWEQQPSLDEREFYARLHHTLSRVIPRYLAGAPHPAISLTGGVDSRVIMAFGGADRPELSSYTYGGMYRDCRDVEVAAEVARACGLRHEVLRLGPEFLNDFSTYAEETVRLTDGTLDIVGAHEVYFSRSARQISPVRITGNYGSEILRGVTTYKTLGLSEEVFAPALIPYIREGARRLPELKRGHPVTLSAFKEMPWHLLGRLRAGQSQLIIRSPYTDNEVVALAYQAPPVLRTRPDLWSRLIAQQNPSLASIPTDMGRVANGSSALTLPKRMVNYALFKAEWYYEGGLPHCLAWIDRRIWRHRPPRLVVGSHKIENYRRWFREELFEYLSSVVGDPGAETPWVNVDRAREVLVRHRQGRGNFLQEINRLVTIGLIQRLLIRRGQHRTHRETPIDVRSVAASV